MTATVTGLGGEEEQQGDKSKEGEQAAVYDGMEGLDSKAARLRFGKDLRLLEVTPGCIFCVKSMPIWSLCLSAPLLLVGGLLADTSAKRRDIQP